MSRFTIYKWKLIYPIAWHIAIVLPHLNGCKFSSENGLVHRIFDTTYNGNNALLIWIEGADCLGANWNWAQYVRYGITWNQGAYEHRLRNDDFLTALNAFNSILTMCWYWFIDVWLSNVSPPSHAKRAPNIILSAIICWYFSEPWHWWSQILFHRHYWHYSMLYAFYFEYYNVFKSEKHSIFLCIVWLISLTSSSKKI